MSFDHFFNFKTKNIHRGVVIGIEDNSFPKHELKDVLKSKYYDSYNECIKEKPILKALKMGDSLLKSGKLQSPLELRIEKFRKSKTKKLDLSCMDLYDIPNEIFDIDGVLELDLSANYINVLTEDILKLSSLKKIRLYNCEFKQFPEILSRLTSLESIDLGENGISDLPIDISKLTSLKEIDLYNCSFTKFPEILYSLDKLEVLNLAYQEDQPPLVISKPLKALKVLDISSNFGVIISSYQPKLEKLLLRNCSLKEISVGVLQSVNLKTLDITLNRAITNIPQDIVNLKKMKSFSFSIEEIDSKSIALLESLSKLTHLLVEFQGEMPNQMKNILQLTNWTIFYIEGDLADMFFIKEILKRSNLKKVARVSDVSGEENFDIEEGRKIMNIEI